MSFPNDEIFERNRNEVMVSLSSYYQMFDNLVSEYSIKRGSVYWDIACFLVLYKIFKRNKSSFSKWVDFWQSSTLVKRHYRNVIYSIPSSYIQFLHCDAEIDYLRRILNDKKESKIELNWERYLNIFFKIKQQIKPSLTEKEFALFQAILSSQSDSNKVLQQYLAGTLSSNISKYKKQLSERGVLFKGYTPNIDKFHLQYYLILAHFPLASKLNNEEVFPNSIFLRHVYEGTISDRVLMGAYLTPDIESKAHYLDDLIEEQILRFNPTYIQKIRLKRSQRLRSFNYATYDFRSKSWNFKYEILSLYSKESPFLYVNDHFLHQDFTDATPIRLQFNELRKKILNYLLLHNPLSLRQAAKELEITFPQIRRHYNYFKENQLLAERYMPYFTFGLSSIFLILNVPPSKQKNIHYFLSVFPEVYSEPYVTKEKNGLVFVIRCPFEFVMETLSSISYLFKPYIEELFVCEHMYRQRKNLPIDLYDPLFDRWTYTKEHIF